MTDRRYAARILRIKGAPLQARALSPCGTRVGGSLALNGLRQAALWSVEGDHQVLPSLTQGEPGKIQNLSRGGRIAVGFSGQRACLWRDERPELIVEADSARLTGVSEDGATACGWLRRGQDIRGFVWNPKTGPVILDPLPGRDHSNATAISADGKVVVGFSSHRARRETEAFRWTAAEGTRGLGFLPNHHGSRALSVSEQGASIVGFCAGPGFSAFRFTDSMQLLPGEPQALAQSTRGQLVVGCYGNRPSLWDAEGRPQILAIRECSEPLTLSLARDLAPHATRVLADGRDKQNLPVSVLLSQI